MWIKLAKLAIYSFGHSYKWDYKSWRFLSQLYWLLRRNMTVKLAIINQPFVNAFNKVGCIIKLVGGLEHGFYEFPFSWEFHNPHWRSPSFFRGVGLNHQPDIYLYPITVPLNHIKPPFWCQKLIFLLLQSPFFLLEIHLDPQLRKSRPVSPAVGVAAHAVAAPSRRRLGPQFVR